MRRVPIGDVEPGQRIARTLYYESGTVMLVAGATLTSGAMDRLRAFGFHALYIQDEDTEDVVVYDTLDEHQRQKLTGKLQGLFRSIREETANRVDLADLQKISIEEVRTRLTAPPIQKAFERGFLPAGFVDDIEEILSGLLREREVCLCVGSLKTTGLPLFDHAVEVAVKTLLIARRAGLPRAKLKEIGLGALLHDIGYLFVPEDLLRKTSPLSPREADVLKQHAIFGYYLLREQPLVPLLSAHVAYQHHERQDGQGYPRGLKGTNRLHTKRSSALGGPNRIHPFAEIVAVADAYDNLTSGQAGRKALAPDEAVRCLRETSGADLNAEALGLFLSFTPVFPLGTDVLVTEGDYDGWRGVVARVHPEHLDLPLVRLLYDRRRRLPKPVEIDLRRQAMRIKTLWNSGAKS